MAKRFTDTEKWEDPWFMNLSNNEKMIYLYLLDKCDNAGFWKPNLELLRFFLKIDTSLEEILNIMKDRIVVTESGKWFIKQFVKFQYRELHYKKPATLSVIRKLQQEGITVCNNLIMGMPCDGIDMAYASNKDKDKEKDKVKDKDKEKESENRHKKSFESLQTQSINSLISTRGNKNQFETAESGKALDSAQISSVLKEFINETQQGGMSE